jgi:hypothetical protein
MAKVFLVLGVFIATPIFLYSSGDLGGALLTSAIFLGLFALVALRKWANPNLTVEYLEKARAVLGDAPEVLAAVVMAPKDDTGALIWSILKRSLGGEIMGAVTGSAVGAAGVGAEIGGTLGMLSGMHAERRANAEAQGLLPVVLVAVTSTTISVLDWERPDQVFYVATSETSITPTRVLVTLDRATTVATLKRNGLTGHLYLGDTTTGKSIAFQGAMSPVSPDFKPMRAVLAALNVKA